MTSTMKLYLILGLTLLLFGLGFGAGWRLHTPKPISPSAVLPKPEVIQQDGSRILERKVDQHAKPPMVIPHGDTVEHTGSVTIDPLPPITSPGFIPSPASPCPPCPPVKLNWTLVREPDGGQRLIVKADGGTITGGEDIIVTPPAPAIKPYRWAVGVSRYLRENTYGIWAQRNAACFVLGGEVRQTRAEFGSGKTSVDAVVRLGYQF